MGKHDPDIDIRDLNVYFSDPTYTGSGSNRVGSTVVTLMFELTDGSTINKEEPFDNIRVTTSQYFNYTIGIYRVTVRITVTVVGVNNQMHITGASAEIVSKDVIH